MNLNVVLKEFFIYNQVKHNNFYNILDMQKNLNYIIIFTNMSLDQHLLNCVP